MEGASDEVEMVMRLLLSYLILIPLIGKAQIPFRYSLLDSGDVPQGYYVFEAGSVGVANSTKAVLSSQGEILMYKTSSGKQDFILLPDHRFAWFERDKFIIANAAMQVVDSVSCVNGAKTDMHELQFLPDGHYLLLGTHLIPKDLSAYAWFLHRGVRGSAHAFLECGIIQEFDRNHQLVFEWDACNHLPFDDVDSFYLTDTLYVGWTHFNAISASPEYLFVSSKFFNQIMVIDRRTGQLVHRLGGKHASIPIANLDIPFLGQHDVRWHPGGIISLFDNGISDQSRIHASRGLLIQVELKQNSARLVDIVQPEKKIYSRRAGNLDWSPERTLIHYGQSDSGGIVFDHLFTSTGGRQRLIFHDSLAAYRIYFTTSNPVPTNIKIHLRKDKFGWIASTYRRVKSIQWMNGSTSDELRVKPAQKVWSMVLTNNGWWVRTRTDIVPDLSFK